MSGQDSIGLVTRIQAGDSRASNELFDQYVQRLVLMTRKRLNGRLSSRLDPEDVVQSAYRSFFGGLQEDRFVFERSGDLWRVLVGITLKKLFRQIEYHSAGKRSPKRETATGVESDESNYVQSVASGAPSTLEVMALTEDVTELMAQCSPVGRQVLELRLQGHTLEEVASITGKCERTVRRHLDQIKDDLKRQLDQPKAP